MQSPRKIRNKLWPRDCHTAHSKTKEIISTRDQDGDQDKHERDCHTAHSQD
jgi:hypothetical protein